MFELRVAWKYLLPKRRQLSVALISLISILVISLVVWLILVFFSVTKGLEKGWIEKLTTLTAPIRLTPTDAYYNSYYYQIDHISAASNYTFKSLGEKLAATSADPYDASLDEELVEEFPQPDMGPDGKLKDILKLTYEAINGLNLNVSEYEVTTAALRLRLVRGLETNQPMQSFISQSIYLGTYDDHIAKTMLPDTDEVAIADGYGVLLPKVFRDGGVLAQDRGYLSYSAPTASSMQEMRIPIHVTGFYDPGIVPLGGRFLLGSPELVRTIRTAQQQEATPMTNGLNVRIPDLSKVDDVKQKLVAALQQKGVDPYWKVETFREFDYSKDLLQQLSSEKHIFGLIAGVIMIVACSNIISMLIILVKDKRLEIGILRAMGASSLSIATIFGICGVVMGLIGSLIGTLLAFFTLHNLNALLNLISNLQGYAAFNPMFYGDQLPNQMNYETLLTVIISTAIISLIAGLIPALKASRMQPSAILRSE